MNPELIIILGTLITIVGLAVVFLIRKRRPEVKKETDYRSLFNMGIIFLAVGIVMSVTTKTLNPMFIFGLISFIMGLANKDKWKNKA